MADNLLGSQYCSVLLKPYLTFTISTLGKDLMYSEPYHTSKPIKVVRVQLFVCTEEPRPALNVIGQTTTFEEPNLINCPPFSHLSL